jgi:putative oxidoreductase
MKTLIPNRVAIIIYAIVMGVFGIFHFMNVDVMAAVVPIPGGKAIVYITGICLILAAISFIIGKKVRLAGYLLALFLLFIIISIHAPGAINGDVMSTTAFLKDLGLMAGAILIANISPN